MYKACIFDLDGTLTDTLESLHYSVNKTLEEMGLDRISHAQCQAFVGNGARYLLERALEVTGDPSLRRLDEAMEIYARVFQENCMYQVTTYPGVREMLAELKRRRIKLAVLSNKPHKQTEKVIREIFGEELFDWVQGQCEEIARKPDPAGVWFVLEKLDVSVSEGIYIGDSDVDMRTGKSAGLLTVGVDWGFRSREVLEKSGADIIIKHAEELLSFCKFER